MTNLEAIKEDYKVGDPIRITCRLGVKEGYIIEITESRIKLRPFEDGRKPISISDESIFDFEEVYTQDKDVVQKEGEDRINVVENDESNKRKRKKQKRDYNPFLSALGEQPLPAIPSSLESIIGAYSMIGENQKEVKAVGFIRIVNKMHGWIWDQNLKKDIYFSFKDICDEEILNNSNLIGIHIVYTKEVKKFKKQVRVKAVGICLPRRISVLLAMADIFSRDICTQHKAYDILENILEQYPDNENAKQYYSNLSVHLKKRIKHSFGEPLNFDNIKELAYDYKMMIGSSVSLAKPVEATHSLSLTLAPTRPIIVTSEATLESLPLKKKLLSESECRDIEKELDGLIRNGEREKCLKRSYEVLGNSCPTSKYLRSYLDRMVNAEIALGNNEAAMKCLAQLIAYNEKMNDTKPNTIAHLYLTLARVMSKLSLIDEALQAIECAEWLKPGNSAVKNMRNQLLAAKGPTNDNNEKSSSKDELTIKSSSISKLLLQDIDERLKHSDSMELKDPLTTYKRAINSISDEKENYYSRSQYFLESAVLFRLSNITGAKEYWMSMANYASMRGNAMFNRVSDLLQNYPETRDELIASCDSAKSYFVEALGIYNDLGEKLYLQDHFLKYLKLERMISMIQGGKTPDIDWNTGTLKEILRECLQKDSIDAQKILYKVCIVIGSTAPGAWFTLASDKDGIGPMASKFRNDDFRKKSFHLFNEIEQAEIDVNLKFNNFLSAIFKHRRARVRTFNKLLENCINCEFRHYDISEFASQWKKIVEYADLLLPTDIRACKDIDSVIKILEPYSVLGDRERSNSLNASQQILRNSLKLISETTTYYGRTFFYHLAQNWLSEIDKQIAARIAMSHPKLRVSADSYYIKEKLGKKYVNFIVSNIGESSAESFVVNIQSADINEKIVCEEVLPAGDFKDLTWELPAKMNTKKVVSINFVIIPIFQGRELSASTYGITFEEDSGDPINAKDIPWNVGEIPAKHIFKGREGLLDMLLKHYLSAERTNTYILYGLTRTGKSSILKYLRDKISGKALDEKPHMKVLPISWDLKAVAYKKGQEADFWENLVGINMYETFSKEIKKELDKSYKSGSVPEILSQKDFLQFIDVLNRISYFPFITIDEFSYVKNSMDEGLLNASFLSILRDMSLEGKAAFVYAGTYDIKELPRDPQYGITGQLTNTKVFPVNEIDGDAANELIDAWVPTLNFTDNAKAHIRRLSGCVPYWIQWICRSCGKFATLPLHKKHWLGYDEVEEVVKILTGEEKPDPTYAGCIDENNFQNNQYTPDAISEHAVITCFAYITKDQKRNIRGVGIPELQSLWNKYNVSDEFKRQMVDAISKLVEKKILKDDIDEGRPVYRINVDLFRRWWYVHHKDLNIALTH